MLPNRGQTALHDALRARKWTQRKVASELKVSTTTVSRWLSGERVPDRAHMAALRELLEISPEAWV